MSNNIIELVVHFWLCRYVDFSDGRNRRTRKKLSKSKCSNMVITKLCQELDVYLLKVAEYSLLPDRADQSLKKNQTLERSSALNIF